MWKKLLQMGISLVSDTRTGVWCLSCKARRSVKTLDVIEGYRDSVPYKRLVGKCLVCDASTSTFLPL